MNLGWIKLFLALLWLVPGFGFLAYEWSTGQVIAIPIGGRQLPLAWPFLLFGSFNLVRWWASRPVKPSPTLSRRSRRRQPAEEPDPNFDFENHP